MLLVLSSLPAYALPKDDLPSHLLPFAQVAGDNGDYETQYGDWPPAGTYYIVVDITNQIVTAYKTETNEIVRQCLCSTGTTKTPTPLGTFTMPDRPDRRRFTEFPGYPDEDLEYGQYMTKIDDASWFHSILYTELDARTYTVSYSRLGKRASHGCIRLPVPDARWIYFNSAPGTQVIITDQIPRNRKLVKSLALPKAPKTRPKDLSHVPQIFAEEN